MSGTVSFPCIDIPTSKYCWKHVSWLLQLYENCSMEDQFRSQIASVYSYTKKITLALKASAVMLPSRILIQQQDRRSTFCGFTRSSKTEKKALTSD